MAPIQFCYRTLWQEHVNEDVHSFACKHRMIDEDTVSLHFPFDGGVDGVKQMWQLHTAAQCRDQDLSS